MRDFARKNTEILVVFSLFAIFALVKIVVANQIAFLNLYFIPVLLSGYFLGQRRAILSAVASVLLATFFMIKWPDQLLNGEAYGGLNIVVWASLLILTSIIVSTLNENRAHRQAMTTLRLLEKYIKDMAKQENHSARVGRLAREIARELRLHPRLVSGVEAAGLLHDITDTVAGMELIGECGNIPTSADYPIISDAIPILSHKNKQVKRGASSIGPKILLVADLYDTAVTEKPNRNLLQVVQEIEKKTDGGSTIVIKALIRVINKKSA